MRGDDEIFSIVEKRGHRLRRTLSARSARQRDLLELFLQMENLAWRADSLTQSFESQCSPLLQASAPEMRSSCSFLRSLNARDNKTSNFVWPIKSIAYWFPPHPRRAQNTNKDTTLQVGLVPNRQPASPPCSARCASCMSPRTRRRARVADVD